MSDAYYNDNEPYVVEWLGNLAKGGLITDGRIDGRPMQEVRAEDVREFRRCHFFAGIGGWDYALKLAGWPADREVWTGSCPCQPFSQAGRRKGVEDERHLWPVFRSLIAECHPPTIFGEQVASKDGRLWLDRVRADLEEMGYAVGCADLCAASLNAPHIRQRLWWVADAGCSRIQCGVRSRQAHGAINATEEGVQKRKRIGTDVGGSCGDVGVADTENPNGRAGECEEKEGAREDEIRRRRSGERKQDGWMANGVGERLEGMQEQPAREEFSAPERSGGSCRPWDGAGLVCCSDGKSRRIESGIAPLAHGVSARVGKLRAYGNAIVPQVAAEFIGAYLEGEEACHGIRNTAGQDPR